MAATANFVKETISVGGIGNLTLSGAVDAAHLTFNTAVGVGNTVNYVISDGNDYEIGIGRLSTPTTMTRIKILQTVVAGVVTHNGTAINVTTNATISISNSVQSPRGIHSGFSRATSGVEGLISLSAINATVTDIPGRNNLLMYTPFTLVSNRFITKCMVHCSVAAASIEMRIGIFSKAINGKPLALLKEFTDAATISLATTGPKTATPTVGIFLSAGDYYIGQVANDTALTTRIKGISTAGLALDMGATSGGTIINSLSTSHTFGALPTVDQDGFTYTEFTSGHLYWLS